MKKILIILLILTANLSFAAGGCLINQNPGSETTSLDQEIGWYQGECQYQGDRVAIQHFNHSLAIYTHQCSSQTTFDPIHSSPRINLQKDLSRWAKGTWHQAGEIIQTSNSTWVSDRLSGETRIKQILKKSKSAWIVEGYLLKQITDQCSGQVHEEYVKEFECTYSTDRMPYDE